jgi:hypothetical protein
MIEDDDDDDYNNRTSYAPRAAASQPQQPHTVVNRYKIGLINAMHPT